MIEDDEEMVALGQLILQKQGFEVLAASDGPTGLDMLQDGAVDLVLLDVMMDGMDGWEVLNRIRTDQRYDRVPVIMLTARHYLEDEEVTASHAGQYQSYLVKPFMIRELVEEVRKALPAGE